MAAHHVNDQAPRAQSRSRDIVGPVGRASFSKRERARRMRRSWSRPALRATLCQQRALLDTAHSRAALSRAALSRAASAAAQPKPALKLKYFSAWFCPFAHRATLALEHHADAVPYTWEESLGWEQRQPTGKENFEAEEREDWWYHWCRRSPRMAHWQRLSMEVIAHLRYPWRSQARSCLRWQEIAGAARGQPARHGADPPRRDHGQGRGRVARLHPAHRRDRGGQRWQR